MQECPYKNGVTPINEQDGCTVAHHAAAHTGTDVTELMPDQRKEEYYFLLAMVLPAIVEILRRLRKQFPHGLVAYGDDSSKLVSSLAVLQTKIAKATEEKNFLLASYWTHNAIAVSIDIATEMWAKECNWNDPALTRLAQLVDSERQALYGQKAAQKRISSAMIQTIHISASFERFMYSFFKEKNERDPSAVEMMALHHCSLKSAASLTELHLERTRKIRPVLGSETEDGGIIHRYINSATFSLTKKGLQLDANAMADEMKDLPIDASDGRIGCPGKKNIPEMWHWIEELSVLYSYPLLAEK